ncbi:MAG: winged helix-turn-helix transcriptional regulator [Acidobacteriota bacterium]
MAHGYGQYCPLALAAELLCQRWTILVVSRLIDGCRRFNEIHQGLPQISPSLLSKRLGELQEAGLVRRFPLAGTKGFEYRLTEAGRELEPIVDQLAVWGQRWARDNSLEDLDPAFLVWSMHLRMNVAAMPTQRVVLEFDFSGTPKELRRFWLVCQDGEVEMCLKDPGYEADVAVASDLRVFVEAWRGFRDLRTEIRSGRIRVHGPSALIRQLPDWLILSGLARFERRRPGRERRLARRGANAGRGRSSEEL